MGCERLATIEDKIDGITSQLERIGSSSSDELGADSTVSKGPVRGLALFQNAALVFAAGLIGASLIGLSGGNVEADLNGRRLATVYQHVIAWLGGGAALIAGAAMTTQLTYAQLIKTSKPSKHPAFAAAVILSAIGLFGLFGAMWPFFVPANLF